MLFNSVEFLFAFLPLTLLGYYLLNASKNHQLAKIWLLCACFVFYGWYNPKYLLVLGTSVVTNFILGKRLLNLQDERTKKLTLVFSLVLNVAFLFYFKYVNFFIENVNWISGTKIELISIVLPLGISFFTFQQIAYLVDCYKKQAEEYSFSDYCLFVSFFPYVISGPIAHHKEMLPQFNDESRKAFDSFNFSKGLYLFFMGLIKKVVVADTFAVLANAGFGATKTLGFLDSWLTSLSYTIQLYFDFSGYSDMALGIALLFNLNIPINFNSPYKAVSIQDFWRRWHITLSSFLRDYIYIPLGGNRAGEYVTLQNLVITFLVGGIWHGAAWTFIIWGAMHGVGTAVHRTWKKAGYDMPDWLGWIVTLLYVNVAWIFFRAVSVADALEVLKGMIGLKGFQFKTTVLTDIYLSPMLLLGLLLLPMPNPPQLAERFKTDARHLAFMVAMLVVGLIFINSITASDFLYFDF